MSLALLFISLVAVTSAQEQASSRSAAERWLELIDEGRYEESWDAASPRFRRNMSRFGKRVGFWVKALATSRGSLGEAETRRLVRSHERTSMPGTEAGQFVDLVYRGDFAAHEAVVETIVVTLDDDSEWRVYDYVIRR